MQAMLLAAGLGTRLRPYSNIRPKPLFPVLNRPLLYLLLDMLQEAGCSKIIVNGHHLGDQLREALTERNSVSYQYEPEILGTGGSLRQAITMLDDQPLLVMNGDIFHNIDIVSVYENHCRSGNKVTMAMHDHSKFNSVVVRDGFVHTFRPEGKDKRELLAFTGIHVVDPAVIEMIPPGIFFHIIDLYEKLAEMGEEIRAFRVDGTFWRDIGTPDDYLALHEQLLTGEIKQPLPVQVPNNKWLVSNEAQLGPAVKLEGWGCVGNARIGAGVRLCNCVVWDDAVIEDGVCLNNTIVAPGL